jgi:hypothetical protein
MVKSTKIIAKTIAKLNTVCWTENASAILNEKDENKSDDVMVRTATRMYVVDTILRCLSSSLFSTMYFTIAVWNPSSIGIYKNIAIDWVNANLPYSSGPMNLPVSTSNVTKAAYATAIPGMTYPRLFRKPATSGVTSEWKMLL